MKRCWSFLPVLLAINSGCDCGGEINLDFSCPQPEECYLPYGEENTTQNIILGKERLSAYSNQVCSFGVISCNEETQEITCENVKYPEEEICDGIDNDCNGEIDDGDDLFIRSFRSNNPCKETELGVCKNSDAQCVLGQWICIPPERLYGNEVCDGLDNDCDGDTDEDIEENFIYTGPPETLNVGECRAGIESCIDGQMVNFGMVTPIPEICGNEDDDDCDGVVDERENQRDQYDFALIIDTSGSMHSFLYSIRLALCDWQSDTRFQNSRFAILAVATDDIPYGARVVSDFVNAGDACDVIDNFLNSPLQTMAEEFQLDLILKTMTVGDEIEISWSANRERKIVLFSDEIPQFLMPPNPASNGLFPTIESKIDEIVEACTTTQTSVSVFTKFYAPWNVYWRDMVDSCNGYLEFLNFDHYVMLERLNYWFGEEC